MCWTPTATASGSACSISAADAERSAPARAVEQLDGRRGGRPRGLQPLRDRFRLAHRAQDVPARELAEVLVLPAAPRELREELRVARHVLHPFRPVAVAVV